MKTSFTTAIGTLYAQDYICMLALVHTQRTALSEYKYMLQRSCLPLGCPVARLAAYSPPEYQDSMR